MCKREQIATRHWCQAGSDTHEDEPACSPRAWFASRPGRLANNMIVLVVDDYRDSQELLELTFRFAGFVVLVADNGENAVRAAKQHRPDAVVMDLHMPVMDGFEATRQFKADAALRFIPVVAYSAAVAAHWPDLFSAICQKPCSLDHLVDVVNEVIAKAASGTMPLQGTTPRP